MMVNSFLAIPILVSFFLTLALVPPWIKRAKNAGLVGKDINKFEGKAVAEAGGVTVLVSFALGILIYIAMDTFFFKRDDNLIEIFAIMTMIFFVAFIGFTDDILGWKIGLRRRTRMILVAFASIPLIAINAGRSVVSVPILGSIDLGLFYPLILIPIGVVGVTTTYNFLAGFNGLEAGQGVIFLSALAFVSYFTGNPWLALIALCMVGALLAFLIYNFYPSQVFPGDSLTYSVGGLIAAMAIVGNFERIAAFFFAPYIIEVILKIRGKLVKQSFATPRKDGSLDMKYDKVYSLNHLAIYLMKKLKIEPTEKRAVLMIWTFQIVVIILGIAIFWRSIF